MRNNDKLILIRKFAKMKRHLEYEHLRNHYKVDESVEAMKEQYELRGWVAGIAKCIEVIALMPVEQNDSKT